MALSTSRLVFSRSGNLCHTHAMKTIVTAPSYKGFRFPQEIICYAVWLYFRFNLSYRGVAELLAARGVIMTYETVRQWCRTFGQQFANQLRRRRVQPRDKWHPDEVFLKINGKIQYLWRDSLGYPRAKPSQQSSHHQVLSQTPERLHVCAACPDH
jgi:hypothetical protein